ncbi:hypothetical protein JdFRA1000001_22c [uncultured archaeal virus]|uniref:Uncharacterized protein n=1 Tax=uncultured archaeal virus TaxID=1960247 RepID=A0A1S5Y2V9_9VIRU|nr:hypothetical protein JdFRA1000001_22c [uncultured archaeal virus]
MGRKGVYLFLLVFLIGLLGSLAAVPARSLTVQYQTLASFDFLSASEVAGFVNTTLAGEVWNSWNTTEYGQVSYSVSSGSLNITSTSGSLGAKEGLLMYPHTWEGYAEITLTQGVIAVLEPDNSTAVQYGYEVVKTSSGITVYLVNGTSKTALSSLTTSQTTVIVTVENGEFKVNLADGTGIYSGGSLEAGVLALGAEAGSSGVFDKVVLYGEMLAGTHEIDLGTKTVTPAARIASFSYDVSKYSNIQSARLIVTLNADLDSYARYYIISTTDPGNKFWGANKPASFIKFGVAYITATIKADVTSSVTSASTGTFYIGVSVYDEFNRGAKWIISAKLVLDADTPSSSGSSSTTEQSTNQGLWDQIKDKWNSMSDTTKYLLLGIGVIVIVVIIIAVMQQGGFGGGKKKGIAPIVAFVIMLLALGGITAAVLAYFHPEYLTAIAFGLGAIGLFALLLFFTAGKNIPNPMKVG